MADDYAFALIRRFENPHLNHRLRQIAMDGSEKVPYRLIATVLDRFRLGQASPALGAAIRAWAAFCIAETKAGRPLNDPRAEALAAAANQPEPARAILDVIGAGALADII
jgi:fructuronate reductase